MTELAKIAARQARTSVVADRLDRTAADLGRQHWADVPQGEEEAMGQHLQEGRPQFEPPMEFIPMGPRDAFVRYCLRARLASRKRKHIMNH